MRFVAVKTVEQQAVLMLHKTRDLLVRQRTMLINALRGHLGEYGVVAARGPGGLSSLIATLHEVQGSLPPLARSALHTLASQLRALGAEVERLEALILAWHRADATSRRLATIPGIGPITASAIAATVPDVALFRSGQWLEVRVERAGVIREPIRGLHQGQQPCAARTGRTHDCTRPASDVEIPLHRRARPHMGHWSRPRLKGPHSRSGSMSRSF